MFYYILFLVFLTFTVFSVKYRNSKVELSIAIFLTIATIVIGTIRWKTGYDWVFYLGFYEYVRDYVETWRDLKITFEPLFTSFYFLAKATGIGFVLVQFLQIFIIGTVKYSVFKRYTPYIVLAIFLNFCFFPDIVTVRNFLAAAIVLFSLRFVEEKKPIKFILVIIIASNIHYSALLSILFYPIYYWRISVGIKSLLLLLSIIIGFSGIFGIFLNALVGGLGGGGGDIGGKLSHYSEITESGEVQSTSMIIIILGIIRRLLIIPILFYFEEKYFKNDKLFKGVSNLFIFGNIIYFIVGNDFRIFQRLSIPFYFCEVLLLVWIYAKIRIKPVFFAFLVLYGFSKYYYIYTDNRLIDPYITIFNYNTPQQRWDIHKPGKPFE